MYEIKGYKNFKGHDGEPCAQGSLYGPKGKVAEWSDDSWGGPMRLRFDKAAEEALFLKWARDFLPTVKPRSDFTYDVPKMSDYSVMESTVAEMSYEVARRAEYLKHAKKGMAYLMPDATEPDGKALFVSKAPYTEANAATLKAKNPTMLEFLNETLGLPFVDGEMARKAAENKRYKALCKAKVIFSVRKPDGTIQNMSSSQPYSTAAANSLRTKYPNLVEIYNERFL